MIKQKGFGISRYLSLGIIGVLLMMAMVGTPGAYAGDMPSTFKKSLEASHVPIYPGAKFSTSDERNAYVAIWFDTKDKAAKIMQWYGEKLPKWQHVSFKGQSILYKGPEDVEATQVFTKPYPYLFTEERDDGSVITIVVQKQA